MMLCHQDSFNCLDEESESPIINDPCSKIVNSTHTTDGMKTLPKWGYIKESEGVQHLETFTEVLGEQKSEKNIVQEGIPIVKKIKKSFPSETKNIAKNFAQAFKAFLNKTLSTKDKTQYSIRKFLKSSPNQLGLQCFRKHIKSSTHLTQLAELYFGSFGWARTFMLNNKTDLDLYYRQHSIWMSQDE